jgi:hypothetical protein
VELKTTQKMVLAAMALSGAAFAQTKAPEPDYTLSYNVGVVTDYRYRGISQSRLKPALQGGVDFAHKSGFYLGTWASTIKWIKDAGGDAPVEIDVYGGYKGTAGSFGYDVGVLTYQYPGHDRQQAQRLPGPERHLRPGQRLVGRAAHRPPEGQEFLGRLLHRLLGHRGQGLRQRLLGQRRRGGHRRRRHRVLHPRRQVHRQDRPGAGRQVQLLSCLYPKEKP